MTDNLPADPAFAAIVGIVVQSLSATSEVTYNKHYTRWLQWCKQTNTPPTAFEAQTVISFVQDTNGTKATQQNKLAAMRKLVIYRCESAMDAEDRRFWEFQKFLLSQYRPRGGDGQPRESRALEPSQVIRLLEAVKGERRIDLRNEALISFMFHTGARVAEVVNLKWVDLNLTDGTCTILHGKGDKRREITIFGDDTLDLLKRLKAALPDSYEYIFTPLATDGNTPMGDVPLSTRQAWGMVEKLGKKIGLDIHPHTARHTLLTEMSRNGFSEAEIQAQAGHVSGATTAKYTHAGKAALRRQQGRLRY